MSTSTKKINMTIDDLYQIRRDCLVNDDKDTVFFCYKAGKLVKTLSAYDSGFACSRKEFESFDVIEYFNIESTITYTKKDNSCVEEIEIEEVEEEEIDLTQYKATKKTLVKKVAKIEVKEEKKEITEVKEENQDSEIEVFEVNGIHCIEKELEKEIEDDKIAYYNENSNWYLINDNYKDAETIEEEEIDLTQYKIVKIESSETGNDEVDKGFWVWEAENGVFYLEEEGCFMKFESLEKLIKQFEFDKNLREEEVEYYDFNADVNYDEFN